MKLIDGHSVIEHAEVNCEDRAFIRKLMHYIGDADVVEPKGDLIGRADAIQALAEYLMEDAQIEWGGIASEDIEDWKELAEQILRDIPSAEYELCDKCGRYRSKGRRVK